MRPLSRLADVTRRITLGDWSQRAEPHGVAELTQLAGDFNEMADAIENDLAGRRIAEREAREAENRLQTIADRVPGAVFQFHIDADGGFNVRFTSRHGSIHRLARNQDGDFPGMARVVLPEDRGGWLDTMLNAARSGRPWAHEYRIHTPDGEVAWMQGQALTVKNPDGSAELYGFVADVTERKALEADLRRAREDAEAADRAKSAFLAMMSHELRTPLVAVTGTLEILALDALDERQRELVDVAMGSARALLAVIGDVLDFSKIEAGFLDLAPVTVAVGPLVSEVVGQHRHAARLRGLELTVTLDPALAAAHVVDAGRLRQVLGNLLGNALKFTREGGVAVAVEVLEGAADAGAGEDPRQRVALKVRDTGIGIAPEEQARLFVPFTQASTHNARSSEGTGLGLAICRQLVEAMGGEVTLQSTPGSGTTVTVELTLAVSSGERAEVAGSGDGSGRVDVAPGRRALPSREEAEREGSLVLLVEDHPVNRQVLAAQLAAIGFRVDTAADAVEALERFAAGRYGLVFTDIQLPHVDGYELARRLRDAERAAGHISTPLLALTASALQGELDRCRAAGMDDLVTKPTTMAILSATLRRWLPHVAWPEPEGGVAAAAAASCRRPSMARRSTSWSPETPSWARGSSPRTPRRSRTRSRGWPRRWRTATARRCAASPTRSRAPAARLVRAKRPTRPSASSRPRAPATARRSWPTGCATCATRSSRSCPSAAERRGSDPFCTREVRRGSDPWLDRQQLPGVLAAQLVCRARGDDLAGLQHDVLLGHPQRHLDVLLGEQDPEAVAFVEGDDRLLDLGDDRRLDALGRLVEQQDPGLGQQRAGDRQLLALAAAEEARGALEQGCRRGNRSKTSSISERPSGAACLQHHAQVLGDGQLREAGALLGDVAQSQPARAPTAAAW